ncbi:NETI motif-containing protein [Anoxybacteroides tepidamans]|uniref:NETI motif-containing protein n=1 Tax=Anoxybacteroides tepidamans TaxID=265948 RepID=UPI0004830BF5|nr:NETI motif-containing protein [Anoxybacillus tepidamans]
MNKREKKKKFQVMDHETIEQCLMRMKQEGYTPIRRMEQPIFREVEKEGTISVEPCGKVIVFEGKLVD